MRILLSRTDRIGDLILSTPAIATVRASFPGAHVTLAVSPYNRVAVERNDGIDELVEFPEGVTPTAFGARFRNCDIAIALAPRNTDLQIVYASRAAVRVGYTYVRRYLARAALRWYVNRVMISEADPDLADRKPEVPVRHEVEQLLDLVALAGAHTRVPDLRLDLIDADRAVAERLPERPIVLHLAQRWFKDGSTLASTLELLRRLRGFGVPLVLTVAPESDELAGEFERLGAADAVLRGLSFHAWAAVFERARCVVTVDTGATHVASAVRRPTVVIFEHRYFRLNSQEWAPYGVPNVLIRKPAGIDAASLAQLRDEVVRGVATLIDA